MIRKTFLLLLCVSWLGFPTWASAQDESKSETETITELDRVKKISEMTGRPIFAVAGKST